MGCRRLIGLSAVTDVPSPPVGHPEAAAAASVGLPPCFLPPFVVVPNASRHRGAPPSHTLPHIRRCLPQAAQIFPTGRGRYNTEKAMLISIQLLFFFRWIIPKLCFWGFWWSGLMGCGRRFAHIERADVSCNFINFSP